jgi:hypothetical protein
MNEQVITLTDSPTPTLNCTTLHATNPLANNYYAILDSGASDNYLTEHAPVVSISHNHDPIQVTIPDGESMQKSMLNLPKLPKPAREGNTIPGLKHRSVFSVNKLCQASYKVIVNNNECIVLHENKEIMKDKKKDENCSR